MVSAGYLNMMTTGPSVRLPEFETPEMPRRSNSTGQVAMGRMMLGETQLLTS